MMGAIRGRSVQRSAISFQLKSLTDGWESS